MSDIEIESAAGSYSIYFENTSSSRPEFSALVIDSRLDVPEIFSGLPTLAVEASEKAKTLETVGLICRFFAENNLTRSAHIVAVGGGVIQDLCTLASSIYMRGIKWSYYPSTFTGMVDSCIGGKSSINLGSFKNLVGNFYPPASVHIDLSFLQTLPFEHYVAGLMEAVKILYARTPEALKTLSSASIIQCAPDAGMSLSLVTASLTAKKWFVEIDEHDQKERLLLNFGHTFGHALEAASGYRLQHGLAVGIGMLAAIEFAGVTSSAESLNLKKFCVEILRQCSAVRELNVEDVNWSQFEKSIKADKKAGSDHIRLVLPTDNGHLALTNVPNDSYTVNRLAEAVKISLREVQL